jgi:PAS domain S-box-containing protein
VSTPGKESQDDLLRLAVELAPSGLLVVDAGGRILLANAEVERLFGYTRDELMGASVDVLVPERMRAVHPGHRNAWFAAPARRYMGAGRELHGLRKDGKEVPVEIGLNPVRTGSRVLVLASVVDISARRRAEQRFHAAVESAPSGMLMVDATGRIVLVNREIERLFGWSRAELDGQPVEMLVPERFRAQHPQHRAGFFLEPRARPMGAGRELFGLRKDGSEIPIEIGLNPIVTEDGTYVLSSVVDISARRQAERQLRESEERFRLLVDGVQDYSIIMLHPDGRIASWNAGAERILGYAEEEALGQHFEIFFTPDDRAAGLPSTLLERAARDGRSEEEGWRVRKDGSRFLVDCVMTSLHQADGQMRGFVRIARDVTEQRKMQEQLRQSQKMEAIGTLAGGIAHDFNNLLAGVLGYAELARGAAADRPDLCRDLDNVVRAAERGRSLVQRILTFSRQQGGERVPLLLEAPLREVIELLRSSLPSSIGIHEHLDAASPRVLADATQVQQLVMNLATNAAQAMGERGGSLFVTLAPFQVNEALAATHPDLHPGLAARLSVEDTGGGMEVSVLRRIFDPFFTTKPPGVGTGLGLAIVHGIVKAHGGAVLVESRPGVGTRFDVYFPATRPAEDVLEPSSRAARARLLYVEDEEALAALAKRQLEEAGYAVTAHTSSLAALEEFRRRPNDFDAVVTDNTMPHMTGIVLATEMLRIRADVPILMVSGLGLTMNGDTLRTKGVRALLPKPFKREELVRALEELLGGGGASSPDH